MPDDTNVQDATGPLLPAWTTDPAADATVRYIDVTTTALYGDSLYGKPRGVMVDQGTVGKLRMALFDYSGAPLVVNVGGYSAQPTLAARYREASGLFRTLIDATGALSTDGTMAVIDLPAEVVDLPGVYTVQFRVVDGAGMERVRNELWVYVDRGMWRTNGDPTCEVGMPTTRELRTAVRDHPGANRLLGNYEFDVAELAQGIVSAIQTFETSFPPIHAHYGTTHWPTSWRWQLVEGALGYLFSTAASYNRRGMLPYEAGGVSINDLAKEKDYMSAADYYRQRFEKWCKMTRARISVAAGFGSLGSGYPGGATY